MYRVTSHILSSRSMLLCRPAAEFQLKSVTRYGPQLKYKDPTERDTCPPPLKPPPPPPKDDRMFWGTLGMLVIVGGFAFYAKQTPEVRDWLSLHASWFDDMIAIAYEENMTYKEFAEQCVEDMKKRVNNLFDDKKPRQCSLDGEPVKPVEAPPPPPPPEKKEGKESGENRCHRIPPAAKKGICDVEVCLHELGEEIVNNYLTARDACLYYNKLIEENMAEFNIARLKEMHEAKDERIELIQQSSDNVCRATAELDELYRYVECGGVQGPKEKINKMKTMVADFRAKIATIRSQFQWENQKSIAFDSQVFLVEELVTTYTDQNQTLFSGLRYEHKKPVLHGDPDLLIYHSLRYLTRLQNELSEAAVGMTDRVNRALETLPQNPKDLAMRTYAITTEYMKRKNELDKDFKRRADEQKANNDRILKKLLETPDDTLEAKVLQKEKEMMAILNKLVAEKVVAEKKSFAAQLAEMAAKLKSVEDKLNARLKAERQTRRSQELYAAGAALLAATKKGDPIVKVDKELKAIEKASEKEDELVQTVMKSIPESVRTQGIVPESVLRERYHRMEKAALRVALVEQDGGVLPIFFLSWLQSLVLFMKLSCIPQAEVDKMPQEPFKDLDTFDLLRRARYYIERGNLAAALRYVSSLDGASRLAASTWFEQARSHLETRQAAEAVLAHAAALGLQYI